MRRCECKLDAPDLNHWEHLCFCCKRPSLAYKAVCDCDSQCGHLIGVSCYHCGAHQYPKMGEGWCKQIRQIKSLMKAKCIRYGCRRDKRPGYDYCGKRHATEDGCYVNI